MLRAAYIADWIAKSAFAGRIKPVVLEGEYKQDREPASSSFDIILQVAW